MLNQTRVLFNAYCAQIARLNNVIDVAHKFDVTPAVQQELEKVIQESTDFLNKINLVPVIAQTGEIVGVGVSGPIASRTDTSADKERVPRDVSSTKGRTYMCIQTNYDTAIRYPKLDAWGHKPEFQILLRNAIAIRQALDRIMIGFNGVTAAANTNLAANPLLQDVNKGWLQHMREDVPGQVMKDVVIGDTYKSLDGLVYDMKNTLIKPWYRQDPGLVALVGEELLTQSMLPIVDTQNAATEKLALNELLGKLRLGGLPPVTAPYFPPRSLLISRLDNLSIYYQKGSRRRMLLDNPKKDRIENFESSNDAFVVEDYDCAALADGIKLPGESTTEEGGTEEGTE